MAKCSECGTTDDYDFHPNSLIGYSIASGLEDDGCDYLDVKTKEFLCQRCYYKSIGKEFNDERWKKFKGKV